MADARKLTVDELTIGNENGPHLRLSPQGIDLFNKAGPLPCASLSNYR
jgi:hypothetical protein